MSSFKIDFWTIWGLTAQFLFFSRFILQWYVSEKKKKSIIPKEFWYISMAGAVMILVYAIARADLVFLITGCLQLLIYGRNMALNHNK